jgi:hypothetical protein
MSCVTYRATLLSGVDGINLSPSSRPEPPELPFGTHKGGRGRLTGSGRAGAASAAAVWLGATCRFFCSVGARLLPSRPPSGSRGTLGGPPPLPCSAAVLWVGLSPTVGHHPRGMLARFRPGGLAGRPRRAIVPPPSRYPLQLPPGLTLQTPASVTQTNNLP